MQLLNNAIKFDSSFSSSMDFLQEFVSNGGGVIVVVVDNEQTPPLVLHGGNHLLPNLIIPTRQQVCNTPQMQNSQQQQQPNTILEQKKHVWNSIFNVLKIAKSKLEKLDENSDLELELRFGELNAKGEFVAGISKEAFEKVQNKITDQSWHSVGKVTQNFNYIYQLKDAAKTVVRTSVSIQFCDKKNRPEFGNPVHINKKIIANANFSKQANFNMERQSGNGMDSSTPLLGYFEKQQEHEQSIYENATKLKDFRISLAEEKQLPKTQIPNSVSDFLAVRIVQRISFFWSPEKLDKPVLKLDISKSWQGKNREEVETKQRLNPNNPTFELELELINLPYLFSKAKSLDVCTNLLFSKIMDFYENADDAVFNVQKFNVY